MTSRTVVLRTLAKSWSEVNGVKPVIKKWSLKISKFYLTISASSKPGCWYKRGNEANEVVVHVARISQSSRRNRHDCWHKFVDLEKAEMITTFLVLMIEEHNTPIETWPNDGNNLWKGGTCDVKPLRGDSRECSVVQHDHTVCRLVIKKSKVDNTRPSAQSRSVQTCVSLFRVSKEL